jgi:hypothetical protein
MDAIIALAVLTVPFALGYYLGHLRTKLAYFEKKSPRAAAKASAK